MTGRLAAALLALTLGAGCARPAPPPRTALRLALINDPILNPILAGDIGSILINKVIFPGLVRPGDSLEAVPDLATGWDISPDEKVYTFRLRPGVVWHDGQPFTAEDVKFTFDQILDPASGTLLWSDFAAIASVTAVDSLTVRFTLNEPFAPFLTLLGHNAGIVPAHAFRGRRVLDAVDFNRSKPIGTGPFRIAENVSGSYLTLERNPRYWGAAPKLERVIFKIVPDVNAQVAALRAGELDLVTLDPQSLPAVEGDSSLAVDEVTVPQHYYIGFNQTLQRFKSPLVRRALTLAVNRQAIIDGVLRGRADYPQGTIPIVLKDFYAGDLPRIPYDTAAALRLFEEAGWRRRTNGFLADAGGLPFRMTLFLDKGNPSREQTAVAVQQDLKRVGVDLSIETMEFAALVRDRIQTKRYEAYLIWWNTPLDPDQYPYYGTGQANNDVAYHDPAADSALIRGRSTRDPLARRAAYHRLQEIEALDPPVLVLYYPREIRVRRTTLSGVPTLGIRDALRYVERFELRSP